MTGRDMEGRPNSCLKTLLTFLILCIYYIFTTLRFLLPEFKFLLYIIVPVIILHVTSFFYSKFFIYLIVIYDEILTYILNFQMSILNAIFPILMAASPYISLIFWFTFICYVCAVVYKRETEIRDDTKGP